MKFADILSPFETAEFFTKYYTREALYIPGHAEKLRNVYSYEKLNSALNSGPTPLPTLKLAKDGKPVFSEDKTEILEEIQNGATLIVDNIDTYSPDLRIVLSEWAKSIGESLQVNLYLSQPDNQGFTTHYDTHDVLILQVEGFKRWRVFHPTVKFPLWLQKNHKRDIPDTPYLDVQLRPGDVLYLPRGHWHDATAVEEASMHLTVGINSRTGIDYLNWLTNDFRGSEIWRRNFLPADARTVSEAVSKAGFLKSLRELKEYFIASFDSPETLAAYEAFCSASERKSFFFDLAYQMSPKIVVEEQAFYRTPGQQVWMDEVNSEGTIRIAVEDRLYTLSGTAAAMAREIFSKLRFNANELVEAYGAIPAAQIYDLLRRFVLDGVIHIATADREEQEEKEAIPTF